VTLLLSTATKKKDLIVIGTRTTMTLRDDEGIGTVMSQMTTVKSEGRDGRTTRLKKNAKSDDESGRNEKGNESGTEVGIGLTMKVTASDTDHVVTDPFRESLTSPSDHIGRIDHQLGMSTWIASA
jgi:hypothetical protein